MDVLLLGVDDILTEGSVSLSAPSLKFLMLPTSTNQTTIYQKSKSYYNQLNWNLYECGCERVWRLRLDQMVLNT